MRRLSFCYALVKKYHSNGFLFVAIVWTVLESLLFNSFLLLVHVLHSDYYYAWQQNIDKVPLVNLSGLSSLYGYFGFIVRDFLKVGLFRLGIISFSFEYSWFL